MTFNNFDEAAEYVGYWFSDDVARGDDYSSNINYELDLWYNAALATNYGDNISLSTYCFDRTTYSGTIADAYYSGTGVGAVDTWFGASRRLIAENSWYTGGIGPKIYCSNLDDNYSLQVGLLSADEAAIGGLWFDGENFDGDKDNYLVGYYWFGSPAAFSYEQARVFGAWSGSIYYIETTSTSYTIRPVISLNAPSGIVSGTTGTYDHPYEFTW